MRCPRYPDGIDKRQSILVGIVMKVTYLMMPGAWYNERICL